VGTAQDQRAGSESCAQSKCSGQNEHATEPYEYATEPYEYAESYDNSFGSHLDADSYDNAFTHDDSVRSYRDADAHDHAVAYNDAFGQSHHDAYPDFGREQRPHVPGPHYPT
jgi:hypothetical protein